ncbi:MAG TPA: DUF5777 family beta-barrel protein [Longimicrobiales bacterium]|nr:DUF5777 family beta-barrel protein [Longimicrobiales bacterium]
MKRAFLMAAAWLIVPAAGSLIMPAASTAQQPTWHRHEAPTKGGVTVFHSPQSANLPTAETIDGHLWQFEISHRFFPALNTGANTLWGLDGPIDNRLGLAYAPTDRLMLTLERSNLLDNLDLHAKAKLMARKLGSVPFMAGVQGGVAWNTEVPGRRAADSRNVQFYGMVILNALVGNRVALGLVPSYLRNPQVELPQADNALGLGMYTQVYFGKGFSALGEWNVSQSRAGLEHDAGTFGVELETGGHFFKIVLSNSTRLNPAQYLGGTPFTFKPSEWRLGFNITRLLVK